MTKTTGIPFAPLKRFALAVFVLHFILLWVFPRTIYTWGIDFLWYLPLSFQIFWYITGILVILVIPDNVSEATSPFLQLISTGYQTIVKKNRYFLAIGCLIITIACIAIMLVFRQKYHLLGDQIFTTGIPTRISFKRLSDIVRDLSALVAVKFQFLPTHGNPRESVYLVSILHGGIFVVLALFFARDFGNNLAEKLVLFLMLITGQYMFVFFGTGDNYYSALVVFLWYFYELYLFFDGKGVTWRLILSCLAAIYAHPEGFAFVPSCLLVLYFYLPKSRTRWWILFSFILFIVFAYIILGKFFGETKAVFDVPLFTEKNNRVPVFSLYKLSYFFNIYLSNALVGFSLFVFSLYTLFRRKIAIKDITEQSLRRNKWILLTIIPLVFICDIFTEHGLGVSDQDLCTLSALIITLIGLWLFLKYIKKHLSFSLVVLNLWLLIPTLFVFHTYVNVNRMIFLYPRDKALAMNKFTPYVWLGMQFQYETDLQEETLQQFRLAIIHAPSTAYKISSILHYSYWSYKYGYSAEGRKTLAYLLEKTPEQTMLFFQHIHRFPHEMYTDIKVISKQLYAETGNQIYLQIVREIGENKQVY